MSSVRFDPRQSWPAYLLTAGVALAILLTLLAPEASRGLAPLPRLAFWLIHTLVPIAFAQIATLLLMRLGGGSGRGRWLAIAVGGAVGAVMFAPLAAGIDALREAAPVTPTGLLDEAVGLLPPVTFAWLVLNAVRLLRLTGRAPHMSDEQDGGGHGSTEPSPDFLSRLRPEIRGPVVALSAELHYLRVHTTKGSDLILYPLGQAVDQMPDGQGMRIHRSHWAAFARIAQVERAGSAGRAVLSTGLVLPVARTRLADLRARLAS
ncbi:MAG: LytTR family transcriptional regulator DNA-binding domain-containing protein [Pseudomonadota bacterium]